MSKKIFLGFLLISAFAWNESARADRATWCQAGDDACNDHCRKNIKSDKLRVDCLLACSAGLEACNPDAQATKK
ncbi:MAG: hypothetical protein H0X26_00205 [Alphaproteobacteria bacterium]|nr:hypothetical protein [Alphaproteobacteria bacterium]